jgi:DNA-directed RNA polymerase subunit RPC12/RpoP
MDIRFECPQCAQHIAIDEAGAGLQIDCPNCQSQLIVPEPPKEASAPRPRIRLATSHQALSPPLTASPPRAVAPPSIKSLLVSDAQYRCKNSACGAILSEAELATVQAGAKTLKVCPKCRLGVSPITKTKSFWARVPSLFTFPVQGNGIWILVLGTPVLAFVEFGRKLGLGITLAIGAGSVFCYFGMLMMDVIRTTAVDDKAGIEWPNSIAEVGPFMLTSLAVFGPSLLCAIMPFAFFLPEAVRDLLEPTTWILLSGVLALAALLYYPMALLAASMSSSLATVNPLVVVPAIFRVFFQYLLVLVILGVMVALRHTMAAVLVRLPMKWRIGEFLPVEFITLYSFLVSARLLGLLYFCNSKKLAWFGENE